MNVFPVHGRDEQLVHVQVELMGRRIRFRLQPLDGGERLGQQRRVVEGLLEERGRGREERRDRAEVLEESPLVGKEPAHQIRADG